MAAPTLEDVLNLGREQAEKNRSDPPEPKRSNVGRWLTLGTVVALPVVGGVVALWERHKARKALGAT